jgi:hypothetical protein
MAFLRKWFIITQVIILCNMGRNKAGPESPGFDIPNSKTDHQDHLRQEIRVGSLLNHPPKKEHFLTSI